MNTMKKFIKNQKTKAIKHIKSAHMINNEIFAAIRINQSQNIFDSIDELPILIDKLEFVPPVYRNMDYPTITVDKTAFKALYELDCVLQRRTNSYTTEFDDGDCYIYGHHMGIKMSNKPGDYISLATIIPIEIFYNKWG